ncbi:MAG: GNAT family N-acetyltransferase [Spirochaeta sp.]|jgi:predicted N-acyltransferase|nr:GNAT family N-acetyltransferase [Spirochaeta sp.]
MSETDRDSWNALADTSPTPLMSWEWLEHLESSGSITEATGWTPTHLTVHDEQDDRVVAAVPLYLRDNSWGEFVFDFAFSELADELEKPYYPKLVGMSPASPTPAFSFLITPGREDELTATVFSAITDFCTEHEIPVLQFNFVLPEWKRRLSALGMQPWEHHGFEWRNEGFTTFDDYLARFRKNQRRNIRRERRSMEEQGIRLEVIHGPDAPQEIYERMAEYYLRTNAQFGPYAARFLTTEFFTGMPPAVREHVWFTAAWSGGTAPLALSMLVRRGERVLGRYWGTRQPVKDLHFNTCYYAPIEWAIAEGITVFDPGMGSPHKVRRGFRSVPNWSLHYFFDPQMQMILDANMERINAYEDNQIRALDEAVPYKASGKPADKP